MATFFRFSSLPNEITLHIIETSDPEDIENLALCCKRVYSLAGKTLAQHKADKTRLSDLCFSVTCCSLSEILLDALTKLQDIATNRRLQRYPTYVAIHCDIDWHICPQYPDDVQSSLAQACDDIFKGLESPYITKDELEVWYNKLIQGMVPRYDRHSTTANSLLLTLLPNVIICYLEQMSREMADMIHTISLVFANRLPNTQKHTNASLEHEAMHKCDCAVPAPGQQVR